MTKPLLVIALGGNALQNKNEKLTIESQIKNSQKVAQQIVPLLNKYRVVLTHGNGPQVGNCVIRVEQSLGKAYKLPLDVCVADSEGEIGYILEQSFLNEFQKNKMKHGVASLLTQVLVDNKDKAFKNPTKPIGNFYTKAEIKKTKKAFVYQEEKDRKGYRVIVPSPKPIKILEVDTIKLLSNKNTLVICAGGGGIPIIKKGNKYEGVEAVIDKDLASSCLAKSLNADLFIILTGEEFVYTNYKTKKQKALRKLSIKDALKYANQNQFPKGSMGPKIEAAIEFVKSKGKNKNAKVIITSPTKLKQSLLGKSGTEISGVEKADLSKMFGSGRKRKMSGQRFKGFVREGSL